jgi:type I restriction enzyme R subunit
LNKKFGLIIDYIGILTELEKAFEKFEASDANALKIVIRDLSKEKEDFRKLIDKALKIFENIKREDTHESLNSALDVLIDPEKAKNFEITIRNLMKSYEMLRGDPFLSDYLIDYTWLIKIYIAYNKKFKKANVDELKISELSKKTFQLVQKAIDVKEIDEIYPTVSVNEEYIEILKKSSPKTIGAAIDIFTNIQHEIKIHSNSPFFINLSKEVEKTYEELRNRRIKTEEAIKKLFDFSERIIEWKKEEKEIGKDKYPIYEAIKSILPKIEKQRAINFINNLLIRLENKKLLFKGWQLQRDVRRKVKAETRLSLLSEFRDYKSKIDELTDKVFEALEGIE